MNKKKIFAVVLLCFILVGGIYYFITDSIENQKKKEIQQKEQSLNNDKKSDTSNEFYSLYDNISNMTFISQDGIETSLNEFKGKNVIITYWDSEFDDSKEQILKAEEFKKVAEEYDNTEYILAHRSDENNKKVVENAVNYIKDNNIDAKLFFDNNMSVHSKLKLRRVPATFAINKEGKLASLKEGLILDTNSMKAFINKVIELPSYATEKFVRENMINDDGGINITVKNYENNSDEIILSESQGIMIEYANITEEEELFNSTLNYINKYMKNDKLISWKVENGEASRVNAVIDDLRVYDALYHGVEKFGVKKSDLKEYRKSIYKYNVEDNKLVDCYDFSNNQKSQRLTLCFGDFNTLGELWAENWRFKKVYNNTLEIVKNGYINDNFPLYYSWYNYSDRQYEKDDLNISEALVTILHLSEIGEEKPETILWLKEQVKNGTLYGKYTVEGKVVEGYEYESTAAYALAALVGKEVNDTELINDAISKMERMRIDDLSSKYYGAFGNSDGSGIYSFDQCMALLAYAELEKDY